MKPDRLRKVDVRAAMDFQSRTPQGVDYTPRRNVQHERFEQRSLFAWVRRQPWADAWAHWPNERRNRGEAMELARQGVRKGMPDNWLILEVAGRPGAVSELKRRGVTRSAVSDEQRAWLLRLETQGWAVGAHRGWEEAADFFTAYVAGAWTTDGEEWWR